MTCKDCGVDLIGWEKYRLLRRCLDCYGVWMDALIEKQRAELEKWRETDIEAAAWRKKQEETL